jgi:hypothetical protein
MRTIVKSLVVVLALALTAGTAAIAHAEKPTAAKVTKGKADWKLVESHLRQHQQYPATRAELVAACNNLSDFSDADKKWFADTLPEGTYKSADDVLKALKKAQ